MKTVVLWFTFLYELAVAIISLTILDVNSHFFLPLVLTGVLSAVIFWVISFTEIGKSSKIGTVEKILWIVILIFVINIAGLVYLILRKRTVN